MECVVVGCGVIGLTTAIRLQEAGIGARIVSKDLPEATTSAVAAAIWYPYLAHPRKRVLRWSQRSLEVFFSLTADSQAGVALHRLIEVFSHEGGDPWWAGVVPGFRHATAEELRPGYRDGWVFETPVIETDIYLPWLMGRFARLGGELFQEEIESLAGLAPLVVNCTGVGARFLAGDLEVHPIRGQVMTVTNPGLTDCLLDEQIAAHPIYVIPRSADVVLGGTALVDEWSVEPDPDAGRRIRADCERLEPRLKDAALLGVKVGLRPGRRQVRLEEDALPDGTRIIHNYGHGGAGFTLSWGCAEEVARMATAPAPRLGE